jgi:hypothetical protein
VRGDEENVTRDKSQMSISSQRKGFGIGKKSDRIDDNDKKPDTPLVLKPGLIAFRQPSSSQNTRRTFLVPPKSKSQPDIAR